MKFVRFACALVLIGLITCSIDAQEKDKSGKAKGQLRQGWTRLGLSDAQKTKIYEIQGKYKSKIDDLEKQIKDARDAQYKEEVGVLTTAQKQKLVGEDSKTTEKKGDK